MKHYKISHLFVISEVRVCYSSPLGIISVLKLTDDNDEMHYFANFFES